MLLMVIPLPIPICFAFISYNALSFIIIITENPDDIQIMMCSLYFLECVVTYIFLHLYSEHEWNFSFSYNVSAATAAAAAVAAAATTATTMKAVRMNECVGTREYHVNIRWYHQMW